MNTNLTSDFFRTPRRLLPALAALLMIAFFAPACAIFTSVSNALDSTSTALGSASDSLESVSTSVRSLSNSLASSSESFASDDDDDDDKEESSTYRRDVRVLTASYLQDGVSADGAEFRRDLGRIAERHGVSDWESDPATYEAIGAGLRQAGVERRQISERFAGTHPKALQMMERGYDAAARS